MEFYLGREWNPETGRTGDAVYFDLGSHMTLQGPTACGKGVTLEIPNLLVDGLREVNIVSIDNTGQNRAVTGRWRSTFSDVVDLTPFGLHGFKDAGCNPLLSVKSYEHAAAIGECLQVVKPDAREPLWEESAADFVGGLNSLEVGDAEAENRTPTLENVFGMLAGDYTAAAKRMVESGIYELASCGGRFTENNRTNQGIISTAISSMRWVRSATMRRSLSVPKEKSIDWARLKTGPRPLSVFVTLGADKSYPGWERLVMVSALNTLYQLGDVKGRTTVFMLSEMAGLSRLESVLAGLGQGRKYGIRFAPMVWQDIGQISRVYGEHGKTTVLGNSGCLFAFAPAPADNDTAEFLSLAAGSHAVPGLSVSDDPQGGGCRYSFSEREERLWSPEKIRRIPQFHGLVWRTGKVNPQPVYCPPYWEIPELRGRYDPDPYHSAGAVPRKRQVGKVTALAALAAAAVIAGGAWLSQSGGHGEIWHPQGSPAPATAGADPKHHPPARVPSHAPKPAARR
jgi:type IV secretory pathway TraG/TraD family ATPase VirD4